MGVTQEMQMQFEDSDQSFHVCWDSRLVHNFVNYAHVEWVKMEMHEARMGKH